MIAVIRGLSSWIDRGVEYCLIGSYNNHLFAYKPNDCRSRDQILYPKDKMTCESIYCALQWPRFIAVYNEVVGTEGANIIDSFRTIWRNPSNSNTSMKSWRYIWTSIFSFYPKRFLWFNFLSIHPGFAFIGTELSDENWVYVRLLSLQISNIQSRVFQRSNSVSWRLQEPERLPARACVSWYACLCYSRLSEWHWRRKANASLTMSPLLPRISLVHLLITQAVKVGSDDAFAASSFDVLLYSTAKSLVVSGWFEVDYETLNKQDSCWRFHSVSI